MRRAQAALEFITTYGWAILIVLVMTGTFAYFGVLNPSIVTPERCGTSPEFVCTDFKITSSASTPNTNISMILKQTIGKTIYPTNFSCNYQGINDYELASNKAPDIIIGGTYSNFGNSWSPTNSIQISCFQNIPPSLKGSNKIKINYVLKYKTSSSGLEHSSEGELIAAMQ